LYFVAELIIMKFNTFLIGGLLLALLYSCNKSTDNSNIKGGTIPTHYIKILNDSFSPQQLTVAVGSSITFVNNTDVTHTIVSDDSAAILSPGILPSTSYFYKKDTVATIPYHCKEHQNIRGSITFRP
jgi:plastocyanin